MSQQPQTIAPGADIAKLQPLDDAIVALANTAHACGTMLDDWQPENERALWAQVDLFMERLQKLEQESENVEQYGYYVPLDVLKRIDEGSNPSIYTRASIDEITNRNDRFRGNMAALEIFRESLDVGIALYDKQLKEAEEAAAAAASGSSDAKPTEASGAAKST